MKRPLNPELLLEHLEWMRRLARSLVGDEARANDVVQQTLLIALERPPRNQEAAPSWLKKVMRNFVRRHDRAEARRRKRERIVARQIDSSPVASEVLERAELQRQLVGMVFDLDEPYRTTVLLRFFEEMSPREIAALQGVDVSTVRRWLRGSLETLRHRLDVRSTAATVVHGSRSLGRWRGQQGRQRERSSISRWPSECRGQESTGWARGHFLRALVKPVRVSAR